MEGLEQAYGTEPFAGPEAAGLVQMNMQLGQGRDGKCKSG